MNIFPTISDIVPDQEERDKLILSIQPGEILRVMNRNEIRRYYFPRGKLLEIIRRPEPEKKKRIRRKKQ